MSDYMDVPVADVQVGDEVKVDGYGRGDGDAVVDVGGKLWYYVYSVSESVWLQDVAGVSVANFRRSSIVSARRRKPEPQPKPGDWRCCSNEGHLTRPCPTEKHNERCCVFRASGGWSRDTRDGQPWVMQQDDPVDVVVRAFVGDLQFALGNAARFLGAKPSRDTWANYYKGIGLTVNPVDRRGKR